MFPKKKSLKTRTNKKKCRTFRKKPNRRSNKRYNNSSKKKRTANKIKKNRLRGGGHRHSSMNDNNDNNDNNYNLPQAETRIPIPVGQLVQRTSSSDNEGLPGADEIITAVAIPENTQEVFARLSTVRSEMLGLAQRNIVTIREINELPDEPLPDRALRIRGNLEYDNRLILNIVNFIDSINRNIGRDDFDGIIGRLERERIAILQRSAYTNSI